MMLPNFLIVGAAKAGTTSLYRYLQQHPQVFMSDPKEPRFFAYLDRADAYRRAGRAASHWMMTPEQYGRLFEATDGAQAVGEASTLYLYSKVAARNIHRRIPEARLIAVLRNPVDRAYSQFLHGVRDAWEPLRDFRQAVAEEEGRIADGWSARWHYVRRGFYADQLRRYLAVFGRERLAVYLYEDLCSDPLGMVRSIFEHLEVDPAFRPSVAARHNASWVPRVRPLDEALRGRNRIGRSLRAWLPEPTWTRIVPRIKDLNRARPPLDPELRAQLTGVFREDVLELQDLIDRDLTAWLERR